MKKFIAWALSISCVILYISYGTADHWDGKTFSEIFLFVDPAVRENKTREAFQRHSAPFKITIYYQNGSEQTVDVQPYSTMYVNEYPKLRMRNMRGYQNELICDNYDLKIDGAIIERYDPIALGLSRFKIH